MKLTKAVIRAALSENARKAGSTKSDKKAAAARKNGLKNKANAGRPVEDIPAHVVAGIRARLPGVKNAYARRKEFAKLRGTP